MWKCTKCNEEIEDSFTICWNCGTAIDGTPTQNPEEFQKTKLEEAESADIENSALGEAVTSSQEESLDLSIHKNQSKPSTWSDAIIGGIIAGVIYGLLYAFVGFIEKNTKARMIAFAVIFLPLLGALKPFSRKLLGFIMMLIAGMVIALIKGYFFSS